MLLYENNIDLHVTGDSPWSFPIVPGLVPGRKSENYCILVTTEAPTSVLFSAISIDERFFLESNILMAVNQELGHC